MSQSFFVINACAAIEERGGLYTFSINGGGKLQKLDYFPVAEPMYSVFEKNDLYVLQRVAFGDESGVFTVEIREDGTFGHSTLPQSTHGVVACHLSVADGDIYAVNYLSGNVIKLPNTVRAFQGKGIHPTRQDASHTHCVVFSPCKKYILITDLGLDKILVFDRNLNFISSTSVLPGHGARHLLFSKKQDVLYCVNELSATVSVFRWNAQNGTLQVQNTFDSEVPKEILEHNTAAAIRMSLDERYLYISNRGEDTIVVFETENGIDFSLVQKIYCGGKGPRDFQITPDERFMIITNMNSDTVTVFALRDGKIAQQTDQISLPQPLCVTIC